jgi:proliferating cell nuclear antigen
MERFIDTSRSQPLKLPYDSVVSIMKSAVPYEEFPNAFILALQDSASKFVKEVTLKSMEMKTQDQRDTLAIRDIAEAVKIIDLEKLIPRNLSTIMDEEGNFNPEDEIYLKPAEQSLFKQNQGPSKYVEDWIKNHSNVVLNICLGNATLLKRIITCIKECVTQSELNFDISKDVIVVQSLGPQNVSLLSVHLQASAFDYYSCTKSVTLGLNLTALDQFLKQATKNDQITILYVDESKETTLILEDSCRATFFNLRLKKFETQYFQLTNITPSCEFSLPSQVFQKTCRDLKAFLKSDIVTIKCQSNIITFLGEGTFGNLELNLQSPLITVTQFEKPATVLFSLPYLCKFAKTAVTPTVTLKIGEDTAMTCIYDMEEIGDITFFLAPRVRD